MAEPDKWSRWLAETRFGGDPKAAELQMRSLLRIRDILLKRAGLGEGKVVLDVGAGEGLMGFGALPMLGQTGRVIFSDISDALLEHIRAAAEQMGVVERCSFVKAGAEDLGVIESDSIDLVTTRSVLIYVDDKLRAFKEFLRVLKPGGRTALFEPIADARMTDDNAFWNRTGLLGGRDDVEPIKDLFERLRESWKERRHINAAMTNFNERDLVRMCVEAGFAGVHTELYLDVVPLPPMNWDTLMKMSGNPLIPTYGDVLKKSFTDEERERYEKHMRPLVERGGSLRRSQSSFTWAFKAPIPKNPWPDDP